SSVITIHPGSGPGTTYIKLGMDADFDITPEGTVTARSLHVGNHDVAGPDDLGLGLASANESFAMPCTASARDEVEYGLHDYRWSPSVDVEHTVVAYVGVMDPSGFVELPAIGTVIKELNSSAVLPLEGAGDDFDLGPLKANDVVPTIGPMGPF